MRFLRILYPVITCLRNFVDLSTTSNHTGETEISSNKVAGGNNCKASRDSVNNSLHRSISSPKKKVYKNP